MKVFIGLIITACLMVFSSANAQNVERLSSSVAQTIIGGCTEHSSSKMQSHAIAVVDSSGGLLAFIRMDGNPPGVGAFAIEKALAVANWRFSTAQMEQAVEATPGFASAPGVVALGGGVPIYSTVNGEFLGAVGVSGESPSDDELCAIAGINAAGLRETRNP